MLRRRFLVLGLLTPFASWAQSDEPALVSGAPHPDPLAEPVELKPEPLAAPLNGKLKPLARPNALKLRSAAALVFDQQQGQLLYAKNTGAVLPIASITKLMTAMVVLDAGQPLEEEIAVSHADVDTLKGTRSRLTVGTVLPRRELLRLALMASENRAAAALARSFPGGTDAFVAAMNQKALALGMRDTRFRDATGLNPGNVSTVVDLAIMVNASYQYPLIREFSTQDYHYVVDVGGSYRVMSFRNSNRLLKSKSWEIGLSKTGYINEAGRCLVMQARIATKPVIIVLLDSWGKLSRIGDANRIKQWIEALDRRPIRGRGKMS
jgi:D-alanyl-D-alanine endopeptidase (penicillin-binding protein 7)